MPDAPLFQALSRHERPWLAALRAHANPTLDRVMIVLHDSDNPGVMLPLGLAADVLLRSEGHRLARFLTLSLGGAGLAAALLKALPLRARPDERPGLLDEGGNSFPSDHALFSMSVAVSLAALCRQTPARVPALLLGGAYTLAVGFAQVYLGVHYPSDVLVGWALGLAWGLAAARLLPPGQGLTPRPPAMNPA